MDYSGSMQFRAHYDSKWSNYYNSNVAYGYNNTDSGKVYAGAPGGYDPTHTYYGIFQSDTYYIYDPTAGNQQWVAATTQPVTVYNFTDVSSNGGAPPAWVTGKYYYPNYVVSASGGTYVCQTAHTSATSNQPGSTGGQSYWTLKANTSIVQFTAAGSNFQVGQLVVVQGLTSNTGMNGNAYEVTAASGSNFTVSYPWNGTADSAAGTAQIRIPGTLLTAATWPGLTQATGLNGNILNFATASRIDCALQALIGGKSTCDANYCYVRGQGERSYISEYNNVLADFYVRMADNDSTATYPNNYSSGTYTSMSSYVSISGRYTGSVTLADPAFSSVCTHQTCSSQHCTSQSCPSGQCTTQPCQTNCRNCTHYTCTGKNCTDTKCQNNNSGCSNRTCDTWDCTACPCTACNGGSGTCGTLPCPGWTCDNWQCDTWTCDTWSTYNYEAWTFTTGSTPTHIDLTVDGTWSNSQANAYLALFNTADFTKTPVASNTGNPATLSYDLAANTTYYVAVSPNALNVTGTYVLTSSQELKGYDPRNPSNPSVSPGTFSGQRALPPGFTVPIGSIPQAQVKIRVNVADHLGVIQQNFNLVRFGLTYFNSDHQGQILVGCDNNSLSNLLNKFNTIYPYNGTPTGEALYEVEDYFTQSASHSYANNSAFVSATTKGTSVDPYYTADVSGHNQSVPCRKSYVVLISDGAWNGTVDPVKPARELHATNLRSDISPTTNVTADVFSIFIFDTAPCGENAMKGIAMFGGFTDDTTNCGGGMGNPGNGYPYPYTDYPPNSDDSCTGVGCEGDTPSGSRCMTWPQKKCDPTVPLPTGHSYDTCCNEWDKNWDKYTTGDGLDKGVPDNYFEASQGQDLQAALLKVLSQAIVKNATASSVATVAQETQQGDIIVRGLFHASDPDTVGRYLWFGHLETYWPYADATGILHYDFENWNCFEAPTGATKHCWDGSEVMQTQSGGTNGRNIYSWDPTASNPTIAVPTRPQPIENPPWDSPTISSWQTRLGLSPGPPSTSVPTPEDLVDWVRGNESLTEAGFSFRDRENWILGDIVYSTPVVVGTPSIGAISTHDPNRDEFYAYRNQGSVFHRNQVIYVGANDGMIHAFLMSKWDSTKQIWLNELGPYTSDPTDPHSPDIGIELWAYMPSNLSTELQYLATSSYGAGGCVHRSMVDLAPQSWEVYIKPPKLADGTTPSCNGPTRCWRTVILGGERGGGDVYFAIDVTDPTNPGVLWEYSVLKNRILYANTSTRSLANCSKSSPADSDCKPDTSKAWPFLNLSTDYDKLKILPLAFSRPTVGRLNIPTTLTIPVGDPAPAVAPATPPSSGGTAPGSAAAFNFDGNQARHVAFVGGGIRIFQDDTSVLKDPSLTATTDPLTPSQRFDLFRPELMAIDIETGKNLLRYFWPIIQNQTLPSKFYQLFPALMPSEPWVTGTAYHVDDAVSDTGQSYACKQAHTSASGNEPGVGSSWSTYWTLLTKINFIPYAMSDPLALDVRNSAGQSVGDDGFVDTVYVGDIAGDFYGLKFNFDTTVKDASSGNLVANTNFGIKVDWWQTKKTYSGSNLATPNNADNFRSLRQPITVPPVASFDATDPNFLHVIFGAGKFEDIADSAGVADDKSDLARTSIYNLKDLVKPPATDFFSSNAVSFPAGSANFKIEVVPRCPASHSIRDWPKTGDNQCVWVKDDGTKDCGENPCPEPVGPTSSPSPNPAVDPCFNCIYDLMGPVTSGTTPSASDLLLPGERIVRKGLVAGGLLFFTTFIPPSGMCDAQGASWLYVMSYDCSQIPAGKNPFTDSTIIVTHLTATSTGVTDPRGWKVSLGTGVASNPVLDSSGTHVIIQMSTGQIMNLPVNLPQKVLQPVGWRER